MDKKKIWLVCFLTGIMFLTYFREGRAGEVLGGKNWRASIRQEDGSINRYEFLRYGKWETVSFRSDSMAGPAWEGVCLKPVPGKKNSFSTVKDNIFYQLTYKAEADHLSVGCSMTNRGNTVYAPERSRFILGVNSEMRTYPDWDTKFFPTLLRCEKNFAWGYFMSPRQVILGVGCSDPVASYGLNYIYEGWLKWKWGHQIRTASLDLLHCPPLPVRHPGDMSRLLPGETRSWAIHMGGIDSLSCVKGVLAEWLEAPMIECDRYTVSVREPVTVTITEPLPLKEVRISAPDNIPVLFMENNPDYKENKKVTFAPEKEGLYTIHAVLKNGKQAEASVYVRKPWSWYMKNARDFVAANPPLFSNACETFYGYYTAFLTARYFPDPEKDKMLEERFNRTLSNIIDTVTWIPVAKSLPDRIQNFSALMGMLADLWRSTGNLSYLDKASHIGDYLCSPAIQTPDGAYRSKGKHYTAVIYTAKSMLDLAEAEKTLSHLPLWKDRFQKHILSASAAVDDLLRRRDNIETEGDMTFEDGMITCCALQLGMYGLLQENELLKRMYASAAEYLMDKHQCLEQLLIPDARMRGATLRYWEALDVYFVPNQIMNSPHGWTAWKIYASYYLYLLTGKEFYLKDFMDTLGACAQIMRNDGHLRWGFVPDPFVRAKVYVEDPNNKHCGFPVDSIVGEQYLDMISPWLRPDDENTICQFKERGGAGDNTVQEIFKAMAECVLTSAYVLVRENGTVLSYNCRAERSKNGVIRIVPYEKIIKKVHLNSNVAVPAEVAFTGKTVSVKRFKGMRWIENTVAK